MAFIKLVTIILLTETIVLLNCRPRNGNDPIFGNYPATVPSILWNQKYVSRLYCFCFPIYRHFHLTFQDHCHDLFRMAMMGNQGSRNKDHPSHPMASQEQGLDPNPFLDLFGFFWSEGAKKRIALHHYPLDVTI